MTPSQRIHQAADQFMRICQQYDLAAIINFNTQDDTRIYGQRLANFPSGFAIIQYTDPKTQQLAWQLDVQADLQARLDTLYALNNLHEQAEQLAAQIETIIIDLVYLLSPQEQEPTS